MAGIILAGTHSGIYTPTNILGYRFALLLIHHSEDGDQQLPGELSGVDILFLKADADIQRLQLPNRLQAFLGVSGKPGGGLDQDLVDPPSPAVRQEPLKVVPLFRGGSSDPLVGVYVHELPVRVAGNQLRIVGVLGGEGVQLIL